jgi:2,4-dienoyl-CoA reductase-like NADH-dependent reductase (Old Yellow Enzyme family)
MTASGAGLADGEAASPIALFSPFACGSLSLRNRVAMAPMTRERAPGGIPTPAMAEYYRRRAAGGVGLIITEGAAPSLEGAFGANIPRFFGREALAAWRPIVDGVHREGACIVPQLWHVGAFEPSLIGMADTLAGVTRFSPSGLAGPHHPCGRAADLTDIKRTIHDYGQAALAARDLGFDGIEIHAAHGYLPDQFLWPATNLRRDDYGGSIANRTRFAAEVVGACKQAAGTDFPVIVRLSQWKQLDYDAYLAGSPDEWAALLRPLAAAGADLFHCSTRRYWEPAFAGSDLSLAAWTRRLVGKPVIAVGSVTLSNEFKSALGKVHAEITPAAIGQLELSFRRGDFDLIAIGRALLSNPDWVRKVEGGRASDLAPFTRAVLDDLC